MSRKGLSLTSQIPEQTSWSLATHYGASESTMNLADDPLRPPKTDLSHVETISRSTWQGLLASAHDTTHLPPGCCEIKSILHRTPSIPGSAHAVENSVKKSIFLEGHATWTTSPPGRSSSDNCDLPGTKKTQPQKVYIGESCPAVCSLSDDFFRTGLASNRSQIPLAIFSLYLCLVGRMFFQQD